MAMQRETWKNPSHRLSHVLGWFPAAPLVEWMDVRYRACIKSRILHQPCSSASQSLGLLLCTMQSGSTAPNGDKGVQQDGDGELGSSEGLDS